MITGAAILFLRETYAPAILRKRAARARKEVLGHSSDLGRGGGDGDGELRRAIFVRAFTRPTKVFFKSPIAFFLAM